MDSHPSPVHMQQVVLPSYQNIILVRSSLMQRGEWLKDTQQGICPGGHKGTRCDE